MSNQTLYPVPSETELTNYEWTEKYPLFHSRGEAIAFAAGITLLQTIYDKDEYKGITVIRLSDTLYEIHHDDAEWFSLEYLGPNKWQLDAIP